MRGFGLATLLCACLGLCGSKACLADEPTKPGSDFRCLESLTAVVGDITFRIDGPKLWTLSGIEYRQNVLAVQDSAYGSVIGLQGVGYLGSAHFLDVPGKPGVIEKENVTQLELFIDDLPVPEFTTQMGVQGKSFRLERRSKIRAIELDSSLTVRDGVLIQSARMRTAEAVELNVVYALAYAWTPSADAYLFGDDNGVQKRGVFLGKHAQSAEGLEKKSRWMAVYDMASKQGAVCYVVRHPATADAWLQFTDAPGVYRKLRLMSFVEQTVPAGFDGTFQTAVGFFSANDEDWEAEASKRVAELKSLGTMPNQAQ